MGRKTISSQAQIAELFKRSQQWVSKVQLRTTDPMPRDLVGATEWGRRNGLLASAVQAPALQEIVPGGLPVQPASKLEMADLRIKEMRARKLDQDIALRAGDLLSREEIEERELRNAIGFRLVAMEYPARARAVIERIIADTPTVERIMEGLRPLAAELLNRADPQQVLKDKSKEEVREILLRYVEAALACL